MVESKNVYDIRKYRKKKDQARFYWNMTHCSYTHLARQCKIRLDTAQRWQLQFAKEWSQRKKENK